MTLAALFVMFFCSSAEAFHLYPSLFVGPSWSSAFGRRDNHQSIVSPRHVLQGGTGLPSNQGWKSNRLNRLTDWVESSRPNRPIICEYQPNGFWLWKKWGGTVLQSTWRSVVVAMLTGLLFDFMVARITKRYTWPLLSVPNAEEPLIRGLSGLKKMWEYQLTIATFVLAFFTSQAFAYWQRVYDTTRVIQGRANNVCMLISVGAKRQGAVYENKSQQLVKLCTRLIRMSHIFFWASTKTASNGLNDSEEFMEDTANCPLPFDDDHIGPILLSPYGLAALVETGQLTREESQALAESGLPPSQYAYALLAWVGTYAIQGLKDGLLRDSAGYEGNLLGHLTDLRGAMFDIDDLRTGRMPLAYVQLVQVLVDSLVMVAPFALYSELGSLSIPLVGLLAYFYRGLLVLSKSFLDPFGVEGFENQNIRVDTLVSELSFGASKRWIEAGKYLPPVPELED